MWSCSVWGERFLFSCIVLLLRVYILIFSMCMWFGNINQLQKNRLGRVVKIASKIVGSDLTPLSVIYSERYKTRAHEVITDCAHTAHYLFEHLPLGRWLRNLRAMTNCFRNSFFPMSTLSGIECRPYRYRCVSVAIMLINHRPWYSCNMMISTYEMLFCHICVLFFLYVLVLA